MMKELSDKILDIRIYKDKMIMEKKHSMRSDLLEEEIKKLSYTGERRKKDPKVENSRFPPFIVSFYKYLFEYSKIPKEDILIEYYLKEHFEDAENGNIKLREKYLDIYQDLLLDKDGVINRLLRSYPSLIRDYHFLLLCYEDQAFRNSYYSLNIDYFGGYDIVVEGKDTSYGVSLFIDTHRGNHFKHKKNNRHTYEGMEDIPFRAVREECFQCGNIYLFTREHVKELKEILKNKSNVVNKSEKSV